MIFLLFDEWKAYDTQSWWRLWSHQLKQYRKVNFSVTAVTILDNSPKFQFHFKKGSSKKFPMIIALMSQ